MDKSSESSPLKDLNKWGQKYEGTLMKKKEEKEEEKEKKKYLASSKCYIEMMSAKLKAQKILRLGRNY